MINLMYSATQFLLYMCLTVLAVGVTLLLFTMIVKRIIFMIHQLTCEHKFGKVVQTNLFDRPSETIYTKTCETCSYQLQWKSH